MRVGGWLAPLVLLIGCFSEPAAGGSSCRSGTAGCPCSAGACDPSLTCEAELDLCIPADCMPGTDLCTCFEGDCFGALQCAPDGLCRDGGGSGSTAVAEVTGPEASGQPESSGEASTSVDPSTSSDASSTGMSEATSAADTVSTDDTGPMGGPGCHACIVAENGVGGDCEMAFGACAPSSECVALLSCVTNCLEANDQMCIDSCCDEHPGGTAEYAAVASCAASACTMECSRFSLACV